MQVGAGIGVHTLQLFNIDNSDAAQATKSEQRVSVFDAITRFDTALKSSSLEGFYSDPRISTATPTKQSSLAEKTIGAIKAVMANELADYKADARTKLEAELGRTLGENETFTSISSTEQMGLSKEVYSASTEALLASVFLSLASADPDSFNVNNLAASPDGNLDIGTAEGKAKATEIALNAIVDLQMGGITAARENGGLGSELIELALSNAEVRDDEELRTSLYDLQRERFENGELELSYKGQAILGK